MPSPVIPATFCEAVPAANADLCVKVSKFFGTAQNLCDFMTWLLTSSGAFSEEALSEIAASITPAGTITMSATTNMGDAWLLCNGQAVSRTTYAALFNAIGTRYGAGDGSTTFNLPDMQGRSPIGAGTGDSLTFRDINAPEVGEERHTMTEDELVEHTHAPRAPMTEIFGRVAAGGLNTAIGAGAQYRDDAIGDTGGGQPFNVVHPCHVVYYFVKT